jgi:uncharacterized protein
VARARAAAADFIAAHFTAGDYVGVATSDLAAAGALSPRPELDENVMAARFANLLFHYTGKPQDRKLAEVRHELSGRAAEVAESRVIMVCGNLLADAEMTGDPLHVTIVGPKAGSAAGGAVAVHDGHRDFTGRIGRLEWYDASRGPAAERRCASILSPAERAAGFICTGSACSSPAFTPD